MLQDWQFEGPPTAYIGTAYLVTVGAFVKKFTKPKFLGLFLNCIVFRNSYFLYSMFNKRHRQKNHIFETKKVWMFKHVNNGKFKYTWEELHQMFGSCTLEQIIIGITNALLAW